MSITVGQQLPEITMKLAKKDGAETVTTTALFADKKTILFALPGAFTPVCSARHLPDFAANKAALNAAGVDQIVCLSVNDAFVMQAWADSLGIGDSVLMLCDGSAEFTNAVGLTLDLTAAGMGIRSQRYAMIIDDGVVTHLEIEKEASSCSVSGADYFVTLLTKGV